MRIARSLIVILLVVAAVVAYLSTYIVDETEVAVKFQLGRIVESEIGPGLHFKYPFVQTVRKFDDRIRTLDEQPSRFLTAEQKNVIVDSFVKWRIGDAARFYITVGGDPAQANQRLGEIIRSGLRNEFGKRNIQEVISGERSQIMSLLTAQAAKAAESLGIQIVDVRVRRIDLPNDVSESIYRRMATERQQVAQSFRARGAEASERIRADADRQRTVILANAYRDAERLRGEGDASAAQIYAQAFTRDQDFFTFYRSLAAYRQSFDSKDDLLLLSPDSSFFRYFEQPGLTR
jgi:membrane protease subunit HflC